MDRLVSRIGHHAKRDNPLLSDEGQENCSSPRLSLRPPDADYRDRCHDDRLKVQDSASDRTLRGVVTLTGEAHVPHGMADNLGHLLAVVAEPHGEDVAVLDQTHDARLTPQDYEHQLSQERDSLVSSAHAPTTSVGFVAQHRFVVRKQWGLTCRWVRELPQAQKLFGLSICGAKSIDVAIMLFGSSIVDALLAAIMHHRSALGGEWRRRFAMTTRSANAWSGHSAEDDIGRLHQASVPGAIVHL